MFEKQHFFFFFQQKALFEKYETDYSNELSSYSIFLFMDEKPFFLQIVLFDKALWYSAQHIFIQQMREVSLAGVKLFWLIKLSWALELCESCCSERDVAHGEEAALKLGRERILAG